MGKGMILAPTQQLTVKVFLLVFLLKVSLFISAFCLLWSESLLLFNISIYFQITVIVTLLCSNFVSTYVRFSFLIRSSISTIQLPLLFLPKKKTKKKKKKEKNPTIFVYWFLIISWHDIFPNHTVFLSRNTCPFHFTVRKTPHQPTNKI